jgi:exopolysaccharide production protein ExoQ
MKKTIVVFEQIFTVLSFLLYTGGILALVISGGKNEGESGEGGGDFGIIKQLFILINLITIGLLASRWKKVADVIVKNKYILLFTILVLLSMFWSDIPNTTLSRSIALFGTNLFGLYLATRYTLKEQLLLLVKVFGAVLLISLIFVVALPKFGIMGGLHAGAWRGIFLHKNDLGKFMVISTMIFLLQSISYNKNRAIINLGLVFSVIFLIMSRSSSSMLNLVILLMVFFVFRTWRWRYEIMIPASIGIMFIGSLGYIWFTENAAIAFGSIGKDPSLTGRTEIWGLIIDIALRKALLGYGYDSFWFGFNGPSAEVWSAFDWHPPHSHNGFLDLWLSTGLLGLTFWGLAFMETLSKGFIYLRYYSKTAEGFLPLIFLVFFVISNLTESSLMRQNDIFTVLFVSMSYSLIIITLPRKYDMYISDNEVMD